MPKTLLGLLLVLIVAPPTLASPPDGPSGEMVLSRDKVCNLLMKLRREATSHGRVACINEVAEIRDPRVAVALGESLSDPDERVAMQAAFGIYFHQTGEKVKMMPAKAVLAHVRGWWTEHETDLRRQARKVR
jgi:hypothetical protein